METTVHSACNCRRTHINIRIHARTERLRATETNIMPTPDLGDRFLEFIADDTCPCVGARLASARGSIETQEFSSLGGRGNDQPMVNGLSRFDDMIEATASDETIMHSYLAIFRGPTDMTERRFESAMWSQLWRLHKRDVIAGNLPADDASNDTDSAEFSLGMAGQYSGREVVKGIRLILGEADPVPIVVNMVTWPKKDL